MKILLAIFLLSLTIVNAEQNIDVFQCRMNTLGMDVAALYIDIEHLEIPKQEPIDRFCNKVNDYQRCVSGIKEEEPLVEFMEAMCAFGFEAIHRNVTCLQMAVLASKGLCMPSRRHCGESDVWFLCSQIVTENLCGEKLAFVMATLQQLRCHIFEKPQHMKRVNYESLPLTVDRNEILIPESTRERAEQSSHAIQRENMIESEDIATSETSRKAKTNDPEDANIKPQPAEPTNKRSDPEINSVEPETPQTTEQPEPEPQTTQPPTTHAQPKTTQPPTTHTEPQTTQPPHTHTEPQTTQPPITHTQPETTEQPVTHTTPNTTKKPITTIKPHPTTSSGINTSASSVNCVASILVTVYMMKNF